MAAVGATSTRASLPGNCPTLFGFEPARRRRIPFALDDHMAILRALLADVKASTGRCVLVGLSSGGDIALRILSKPPGEVASQVDAVLSLGCNLPIETCFVVRLFVRLGDETSAGCGSFPRTSCSRSPMQRHAPRRSHRSLNGIAPPANECRAFAESSKMMRYAMRRRPRYD